MEYKEHHYQSPDGLKLYYREYGDGGQAVVCLPGLSRNSKDFHQLALRLAPRYRVICPDLRGRGRSQYDPNGKNYNIIVYTQDVQDLMDAAGLEKAILIGTSLGGFISMTMAYVAPNRLRAIVLNDAGPEIDPAGARRILAYAGEQTPVKDWAEAAERIRQNYGPALPGMPDSYWPDFARQSYREDENGVPVAEVDPVVMTSLKATTRAGKVLKFLGALGLVKNVRGVPVDAWESFRAVTMPCLVIRGAMSDILSASTVERMQAIKQDLAVAAIPQRGHAPLLDEPESLAAIDAFLDSLAKTGV